MIFLIDSVEENIHVFHIIHCLVGSKTWLRKRNLEGIIDRLKKS